MARRRKLPQAKSDWSLRDKYEAVKDFYEPSYGVRFRKLTPHQVEYLFEQMERLKEQWSAYLRSCTKEQLALLERDRLKRSLNRSLPGQLLGGPLRGREALHKPSDSLV